MSTPIVIVGAGGFGREVHDLIESINEARPGTWDVLGFVDAHAQDDDLVAERGVPVLGGDEVLATLPAGTQYVIAIGNGAIRRAVDKKATALGLEAAVLVHPTAWVGRHLISFAPGTIICALASVTTNVSLGRHTHLNVHSNVGHDCVVGDYVSINPSAMISGNVTIGDGVMVGTGAVVIQGLRIGAGSIVGAGSAVLRDVPASVTVVGIPARVIGAIA